MKTRNAHQFDSGITPAQFDEAMELYCRAEIREAEINKMIENEVTMMLSLYEEELGYLARTKNMAFQRVQSYCLNNKEELFGKRRSISTEIGVAGFRLGTPRLKTAKGSSWKKVLQELKEKLPEYIRVVEEPARDMLLANRNTEKVAPLLMEIGVEVVQDELFFIEPKKAA